MNYEEEILDWQKCSDEGIRRENGWLALAGLFWLKEGKNGIGSDPECQILLPDGAPPRVGEIHFDGKKATLHTAGGSIEVDGQPVTKTDLKPDTAGEPSKIRMDAISLVLIERGGRYAVRMWNNNRPERRDFPPRVWFPVNPALRIDARYSPYPVPKKILLPDALGNQREAQMDGSVTFQFQREIFRLDVSKEDGELFIMFKDATSGKETFPPGRYLTAELGKTNSIVLDFNKSVNPPCAFTDYATCLFATKENELDFRVEAGEKFSGQHD
jgi:uncharacterized protein (DUF1684 family)